MSGGYAYVLDLNECLVNQAALSSGELELTPLTDSDAQHVRDLLATHVAETGSLYGTALLEDWSMTSQTPYCDNAEGLPHGQPFHPKRCPQPRALTPIAMACGPKSWRLPVADPEDS